MQRVETIRLIEPNLSVTSLSALPHFTLIPSWTFLTSFTLILFYRLVYYGLSSILNIHQVQLDF